MPLIETKEQLLTKLRESRAALEKVIAKVPAEVMPQPGVCAEWSAKDVLAHVTHWQQLHLGWWAAVQRGETPEVPAPGFSWKAADVDKLNLPIYLAHRDQSQEEVLHYLHKTFDEFMAVIEATSEIDLFQPGLVSFTGTRPLVRWYVDYAHHDGFARNQIYNALVRKQKQSTVIH